MSSYLSTSSPKFDDSSGMFCDVNNTNYWFVLNIQLSNALSLSGVALFNKIFDR